MNLNNQFASLLSYASISHWLIDWLIDALYPVSKVGK